jgi:peroxiredoxin
MEGRTNTLAPESSQRVSRRVLVSITAALIVSVSLNVLLAHRVRSETYARWGRIAERSLQVGKAIPPITARGVGGQPETISYEATNQRTVLYVFTPACVWCARNMDNLKTLTGREGDRYRFIGLSLSEEGLPEYIAKNDLKFPVYSGLSPETLRTYKLGGTPQTIVVSPEGKVLQDWAGAYVADRKSQVEAFFHVTLPGLTAIPEPSSAKGAGS